MVNDKIAGFGRLFVTDCEFGAIDAVHDVASRFEAIEVTRYMLLVVGNKLKAVNKPSNTVNVHYVFLKCQVGMDENKCLQ